MASDGMLTVLAIVGIALIPILLILIAIAMVQEFLRRFVRMERFGSGLVIRSSIEAAVPLDEEQLTKVIRELLRTGRKAEAIELYQRLKGTDFAPAMEAVEAIERGQPPGLTSS